MEGGHLDLSTLLEGVCKGGVDVRGLLWRSHSDRMSFSKKENLTLAERVNRAGGEVLLDERVRRGGSHHQKLVVIRSRESRERDVALVGGIDLSHGRRDNGRHRGDPQAVKLDRRYGPRPPWHDIQLEIRGPAVADLDFTFRERWEDPTPLNHASRPRAWWSRAASRDRVARPLPPVLPSPSNVGHHAIQRSSLPVCLPGRTQYRSRIRQSNRPSAVTDLYRGSVPVVDRDSSDPRWRPANAT